ncbi:hypothetical protein OF83DRAFT_1082084 [Amylostereum chailletii]|nr:hypothetical protein OF83DRAFT_1082084 [Amylostereum chailletii]
MQATSIYTVQDSAHLTCSRLRRVFSGPFFFAVVLRLLGVWNFAWSTKLLLSLWTDGRLHQMQWSSLEAVLTILYLGAMLIQLLGTLSIGWQRLPSMQIYAFLSLLASFLIVASRALRVLVHSIIKASSSGSVRRDAPDEVIEECTRLVMNAPIIFRESIWNPPSALRQPGFAEASSWCRAAWQRDAISELLLLFVEIVFAVWYRPTSSTLEEAEHLAMRAPNVVSVRRTHVPDGTPDEQEGFLSGEAALAERKGSGWRT